MGDGDARRRADVGAEWLAYWLQVLVLGTGGSQMTSVTLATGCRVGEGAGNLDCS